MKKYSEKLVQFCPECHSIDVSNDLSNPGAVAIGLVNNSYVCNDCGYSSSFFPEIEESELPPQIQVSKNSKRQYMNKSSIRTINGYAMVLLVLFLIVVILYFFLRNF